MAMSHKAITNKKTKTSTTQEAVAVTPGNINEVINK